MQTITTKVLGIILRPDLSLFVSEGFDPVKNEFFYRPLGGHVEFGERSEAALAREFQEELGVALVDIQPFGVLENLFEYKGEAKHEVLFLYSCGFADESFYQDEPRGYREADGTEHKAAWMRFEDWSTGQRHIVPDGLVDMLKPAITMYQA